MTAQQLNRKFERETALKNNRMESKWLFSWLAHDLKSFLSLDSKNGRYTSARTARAWTAYYYANK
jgi:hypothetical protein